MQYRIEKARALLLHKEVRPAYRKTMILPQIRSKVPDAVSLFNAAEWISTRRGDLERSIASALREELAQKHIVLESVLLREIRIPGAVARVIEAKQIAEQQVQIDENRQRQAEIATKRRVIEAQAERDAAILKAAGEARALELRGDALSRYPQLIQLAVAEKPPNSKTITLPTDGNFLFDLRKLEEAVPSR